MRSAESPGRWATVILILTGACLTVFNLGAVAWRSTIPQNLNGTVTAKEIRNEHRPGVDDVHLLTWDGAHTSQVDPLLFREVAPFDRVRKERWARTVAINDRTLELAWGSEFRPMVATMAVAWGALGLAAVASRWPS